MKKIKVGDIVEWKCVPYGHGSFIAKGVVSKISYSKFGSNIGAEAIQIETLGKYRDYFPGRKYTTIARYNILTIK